jgi:hypothetical protein
MQPALQPAQSYIEKKLISETGNWSLHKKEGVRLDALLTLAIQSRNYCSSLVTSCCTLLAWARAEMPVWLRISNFDRFEVAEA